jgi:hypothetical protein
MIKRFLKRTACLALAAVLLACAVSCGKKNETTAGSTDSGANINASENALALLGKVWASYGENEKFPASGGDEANLNYEGPGKFAVGNAEMLDGVLGLPSTLADKVDDAASLIHAMNVNTFTCGVFRFKNAGDAAASASKIKENILSRRWMCGFPDTVLIMSAPGGYIIAVWGIDNDTEGEKIITTFKQKVLSAISGSAVIAEEPIV